jgi:2-amino-4-hydroxy-6-hydroxymethyldihydropteridine diphosphokinase
MPRVALLLGTNLGDRIEILSRTRQLLEQQAGSIIIASSLYETAAWGKIDQANFINQALLIKTNIKPLPLLSHVLEIEKSLGRLRNEKWGPRTIDIDILYYEDIVFYSDELVIPHPYLPERMFSLLPVNEISPDWVHPLLKKNISTMIKECKDNGAIRIL